MMAMTTAIDIFEKYPANQFIPLVPVQTISQLSPLHKPAVNIVRISTDEADKDVYKQGDGFALTKKGLMKLAAAANIQIAEIKKVPPSTCEKCLEMARATRKPPATSCALCPCGSDVAYEVTISIPDPAGGVRYVKASREFICTDEKAKASSDNQYRQAFGFRGAMTESKAMNRAIRAALVIKSSYKARELEKPFAVPLIIPDMSNPEMKAAAVERYRNGVDALYSGHTSVPQALASGVPVEIADDIDDEALDAEADRLTADQAPLAAEVVEPSEFDLPPASADYTDCAECGDIIEDWTNKSTGKVWKADEIIGIGVDHFGRPLCAKCYFKANRARKAAAA